MSDDAIYHLTMPSTVDGGHYVSEFFGRLHHIKESFRITFSSVPEVMPTIGQCQYTNGEMVWDVVTPDGTVAGTIKLLRPPKINDGPIHL